MFRQADSEDNVRSVMVPLLNDTKWDELRLAMYHLGESSPRWRTKDLNGHVGQWDGEWFYHFQTGGYSTIEWVEISTSSIEQYDAVYELLRKIRLPSHRIENGFRVYGYVQSGVPVSYL